MTLTLPLVGVLAVITWLLIKKDGLKPGHAVIAVLFGFYLRETALAPSLSDTVQQVVDVTGSIHP